MKSISDLIDRKITANKHVLNEQQEAVLTGPLSLGKKTARFATYEVEVFNFLWTNKAALGIRNVTKFKARLVDGQIDLVDGRRLVIEVKLRMNWLKACQSEWQFKHFVNRFNIGEDAKPVHGAIVFFEQFSGGWDRRRAKGQNLLGWEEWYLYYRDAIAGKPMDLVMLRENELDGYPAAKLSLATKS